VCLYEVDRSVLRSVRLAHIRDRTDRLRVIWANLECPKLRKLCVEQEHGRTVREANVRCVRCHLVFRIIKIHSERPAAVSGLCEKCRSFFAGQALPEQKPKAQAKTVH
jgi:hypothetical protein